MKIERTGELGGFDGNAAPPTLVQVLAAPWLSIWFPEEAGRRMSRARGIAVVLSLVVASVVSVIGMTPIALWDGLVEWDHSSQPPYAVREAHALSEVWADWLEDSAPQLPWAVVFTLVYAALLCVLGAFLVWTRLLCAGGLRKSLDLAGRAVAATAGSAFVLGAVMSVTGTLATDRMFELQLISTTPWDGRARPDDALAAVWTGLSWLCAPIWFVWVAQAARGARGLPITPESSATCEGCGYALMHRSDSGVCTECGTALEDSLHPRLARPDAPWDRRPSPLSWLETTRLALFHPSKLYRLVRVRGDDRRSGAFAFSHYLLLAVAVFALDRFIPWRTNSQPWTGEIPSVGALYAAAWVVAVVWLLHRLLGMIVMVAATKWGWTRPGMQAGRIIDYQVVFLWPLVAVSVGWCLLIGFWPPWAWFAFGGSWFAFGGTPRATILDSILLLVPSPVLASLLQQVLIWGPPALLLVFWLRRYGLALRAVRWANF